MNIAKNEWFLIRLLIDVLWSSGKIDWENLVESIYYSSQLFDDQEAITISWCG